MGVEELRRDEEESIEDRDVIILSSRQKLSVKAGGGLFGFGGVAVWKPSNGNNPSRISLREDDVRFGEADVVGQVFPYNDTASIYVDGKRMWRNVYYSDAPRGRQDVQETGDVELHLVDSTELSRYLLENRDAFRAAGFNIQLPADIEAFEPQLLTIPLHKRAGFIESVYIRSRYQGRRFKERLADLLDRFSSGGCDFTSHASKLRG